MSKWEKLFLFLAIINSALMPLAPNNAYGIFTFTISFLCGLAFVFDKGKRHE